MQPIELKTEPIVKRNFWSKLRKKKRVELKIENSGTQPLQIFSIPTDPDKVQFKYIETEKKKDEFSYPIMLQENESKKLGIVIKSSFKEWLWSGTDLDNISVPTYAYTVRDPEVSRVFENGDKIGRVPIYITVGLPLVLIFIIGLSIYLLFFRHPTQEVIVSSYPPSQIVRVDGEEFGTTPTLLKVKGNAKIEIGSSDERWVKDVQKEGTIFFGKDEMKLVEGDRTYAILRKIAGF